MRRVSRTSITLLQKLEKEAKQSRSIRVNDLHVPMGAYTTTTSLYQAEAFVQSRLGSGKVDFQKQKSDETVRDGLFPMRLTAPSVSDPQFEGLWTFRPLTRHDTNSQATAVTNDALVGHPSNFDNRSLELNLQVYSPLLLHPSNPWTR